MAHEPYHLARVATVHYLGYHYLGLLWCRCDWCKWECRCVLFQVCLGGWNNHFLTCALCHRFLQWWYWQYARILHHEYHVKEGFHWGWPDRSCRSVLHLREFTLSSFAEYLHSHDADAWLFPFPNQQCTSTNRPFSFFEAFASKLVWWWCVYRVILRLSLLQGSILFIYFRRTQKIMLPNLTVPSRTLPLTRSLRYAVNQTTRRLLVLCRISRSRWAS